MAKAFGTTTAIITADVIAIVLIPAKDFPFTSLLSETSTVLLEEDLQCPFANSDTAIQVCVVWLKITLKILFMIISL